MQCPSQMFPSVIDKFRHACIIAGPMEHIPAGPPPSFDTGVIRRFEDWPCEELGPRPTLAQVAYLFGVSRRTLTRHRSRSLSARERRGPRDLRENPTPVVPGSVLSRESKEAPTRASQKVQIG
jgi:hypothetical protein